MALLRFIYLLLYKVVAFPTTAGLIKDEPLISDNKDPTATKERDFFPTFINYERTKRFKHNLTCKTEDLDLLIDAIGKDHGSLQRRVSFSCSELPT